MSVLLPTGVYVVMRRAPRPEVEDDYGVPVPAPMALAVASRELPGAVRDSGDGSVSYRLDPSTWPVYPDDLIVSGSERWVVRTARLYTNAATSALDYVGGVAVPEKQTRR